ncbi:MAG: heavy-metal-associated domain-containing protein [Clostridia bacterium]|nr:heavy-metal-associated domain-containing protein [Clostridia bacterium]
MKEIIIKVNGMVCGGCENRVQNAIQSMKGVKKVLADHKLGTVTIMAKEDIDETQIKEKIQDIGFDVVN